MCMSVCLHVYWYSVCHARSVQKSAGGGVPGARATDGLWGLGIERGSFVRAASVLNH